MHQRIAAGQRLELIWRGDERQAGLAARSAATPRHSPAAHSARAHGRAAQGQLAQVRQRIAHMAPRHAPAAPPSPRTPGPA